MDVLAPGIGEIIGSLRARSGSTCWTTAWPSAASTRNATPRP